jgi:hypothetical protein
MKKISRFMILYILSAMVLSYSSVRADEAAAVEISRDIQANHTPFGIVFDKIHIAQGSAELHGYIGLGDSALWTGALLAAESFRYATTQSGEALENIKRTLIAIDKLSRISGDGLLARFIYPVDGPYVEFFKQDSKGSYWQANLDGQEYYYLTHTTRDQFAGVFFGLGVAHDFVEDQWAKDLARDIITRLVDYLESHHWHMYNPDGKIYETFFHRPDHRLSILRLASHVNPSRFTKSYQTQRFWFSDDVWLPTFWETRDKRGSYFKFNLDFMYFFNLLRLEEPRSLYYRRYQRAYTILKEATKSHLNAHFNMIDRALTGPEANRDAKTASMLDETLARGLWHKTVDNRGKYKECAPNVSCEPIPVADRTYTDFLWQRDPFTLYAEGDDRIKANGIDYILPYWMARYFEVVP